MNRIYHILTRLENNDYLITEELSSFLNVSGRTIRDDIKKITKSGEDNGFMIESKPRYGHKLIITDSLLYNKFKKQYKNESSPISSESRAAYIILELMDHDRQYITVDALANRYYVSLSTMTLILKQADDLLHEFQCNIERKTNKGIKIVGSEINKRLCVYHALLHFHLSNYYRQKGNLFNVQNISKKLNHILNFHNIHLNEVTYYHFMTFLFVDIHRNQQGYILDDIIDIKVPFNEFQVVKEITLYIESHMHISFTQTDQILLAIKLSGMRDSLDYELNDDELIIDDKTYQLSIDMIQFISNDTGMPLYEDFDLRMNLLRHLIPMLTRIEYNIQINNPMKDIIKDKYTLGYQMAESAAQIMEMQIHKKISNDEKSYLALIFSLAVEKEKRKIIKKNIVLVCGSSAGSAHLLMYQYQHVFQEYLNTVNICSSSNINNYDFTDIDYVFTTVPIMEKIPVPVIQVGYFLEHHDIEKIKTIFNERKNNLLCTYYKKDQFFINVSAQHKEDIIGFLFQQAKEKYELPDYYYNSVLEREALAKTTFGNYIAIPHAIDTSFKQTFVYVAILKRPILWDQEEVQIVLLINTGDKRGEELVHFYDITTQFMMKKNLVRQLLEHPNFDYFISTLNTMKTDES